MPSRQDRTRYPAVSNTAIFVSLFAIASAVVHRYIPLPESNALAAEQADFLLQGQHQPVDWRLFGPNVFAEALRRDKPIMILCGTHANPVTRQLDQLIQDSPEIGAAIQQNFVPVRVDSLARPDTAAALRPLWRAGELLDQGFQIWFLDSTGKLYYEFLPNSPADRLAPEAVLDMLAAASAKGEAAKDPTAPVQPGAEQKQEHDLLLNSTTHEFGNAAMHLSFLTQTADPENGSWAGKGALSLNPQAWDFLTRIPMTETAKKTIDPVLGSGVVDWTLGGFFYQATQPGWKHLIYDKIANSNALMCLVCARLGVQTGNGFYTRIASDTFRYVSQTMTDGEGIIRSYRQGDELMLNRSAESSITPRELRQYLTQEQRDSMRQYLDLNLDTNPDMVPRVGSVTDFLKNEPKIDEMLALMRLRRTARKPIPVFSQARYCSSSCDAAARLIEAARLLGDNEFKSEAEKLFTAHDQFRIKGTDVLRSLDLVGANSPVVKDYIAYADMCMQNTLLTGSQGSAAIGAEILEKGLTRFDSGTPGVLYMTAPENRVGIPDDFFSPQLVDGYSTAANSDAIDTAYLYSCWFRALDKSDYSKQKAQKFLDFAISGSLNLGGTANQVQRRCSGFFAASLRVQRDCFAVVRGKNAAAESARVLKQIPWAVVIPIEDAGPHRYEAAVGGELKAYPDAVEVIRVLTDASRIENQS